MTPKRNRAGKADIEKIFKTGKFLNSPTLTFKFIREKGLSSPRISFIAPKTIAKKATDRNRLRRRGYYALRKYIGRFPADIVGAFVFKKPILDANELENELQTILHKIN